VYRLDGRLLVVLDVARLLAVRETQAAAALAAMGGA
jgi:chemotaxis signal transduction protein